MAPFTSRSCVIDPIISTLIVQLFLLVCALQCLFSTLPFILIPLHTTALSICGPRSSMYLLVVFVVFVGHLWGALLTIPALLDIKTRKIQRTKPIDIQTFKKDLILVCSNSFISVALGCLYVAFAPETIAHDLKVDYPDRRTVAGQSCIFFFITEAYFYYSHRFLHDNLYLYAKIHKLHHAWSAPVALVATYAHPIEHIIVNLGSVVCGPMLCRSHPITSFCWMLLAQLNTYASHSGYWFDDAGLHDLHHEIFTANYGITGLFDYLHDTRIARPRSA